MHEDFIELQYNSILKHVKGDYEYMIFNNGSDNAQLKRNEDMCNKLNIRCVNINTNNFNDPSNIAGEALNEMFKYLKNESIFKIDSDMFFMSDIDLGNLMSDADIIYIPTFTPNIEWMWSGIFGLNTKITGMPHNCRPVPSKGDTFIESHHLLDNQNNSRKKINLFGLQSFNGDSMITSCNNDCGIYFDKNGDITYIEKPNFEVKYNLTNINLYRKYLEISKIMTDYGFPRPYNIDVITVDGLNTIFHFKSSNHNDMYRDLKYTKNKKRALVELLNEN